MNRRREMPGKEEGEEARQKEGIPKTILITPIELFALDCQSGQPSGIVEKGSFIIIYTYMRAVSPF